ncbi:hypothetical protein ACE04B_15690, partial [Rhizobium phaseoli]
MQLQHMRTAQLQEMHQEKRRLCACSVDPILMRALSMGDLGGAIMVLWQAGGNEWFRKPRPGV